MENNSKNENKKNNFYKTKTTTLVSFRLLNSDVEKLNLITKETKIGRSKILRNLIENNPIQIIEYTNEMIEKKYEGILKVFNGYGNNLNQIAARLNSTDGDLKLNNDEIEILKGISEKLSKLEELLINNKKIITRNL